MERRTFFERPGRWIAAVLAALVFGGALIGIAEPARADRAAPARTVGALFSPSAGQQAGLATSIAGKNPRLAITPKGRALPRKGLGSAAVPAGPHEALVQKYARELGLPTSLLRAVIQTESGFNRHAVSPKGAMGLMQLMPETCQRYGVTDPFDPEQNVRAGSAYLKEMLDRFGHLTLALAAYNCGPGAVENAGGVPQVAETRAYITVVYQFYNQYRRQMDRHAPQFVPTWPVYTKKEPS